jgi:hypothetical protein
VLFTTRNALLLSHPHINDINQPSTATRSLQLAVQEAYISEAHEQSNGGIAEGGTQVVQ